MFNELNSVVTCSCCFPSRDPLWILSSAQERIQREPAQRLTGARVDQCSRGSVCFPDGATSPVGFTACAQALNEGAWHSRRGRNTQDFSRNKGWRLLRRAFGGHVLSSMGFFFLIMAAWGVSLSVLIYYNVYTEARGYLK